MLVVLRAHDVDLVYQALLALVLAVHELLVEGLHGVLQVGFFLRGQVHLREAALADHLGYHVLLVEGGLDALEGHGLLPGLEDVGVAREDLEHLAVAHEAEAVERLRNAGVHGLAVHIEQNVHFHAGQVHHAGRLVGLFVLALQQEGVADYVEARFGLSGLLGLLEEHSPQVLVHFVQLLLVFGGPSPYLFGGVAVLIVKKRDGVHGAGGLRR